MYFCLVTRSGRTEGIHVRDMYTNYLRDIAARAGHRQRKRRRHLTAAYDFVYLFKATFEQLGQVQWTARPMQCRLWRRAGRFRLEELTYGSSPVHVSASDNPTHHISLSTLAARKFMLLPGSKCSLPGRSRLLSVLHGTIRGNSRHGRPIIRTRLADYAQSGCARTSKSVAATFASPRAPWKLGLGRKGKGERTEGRKESAERKAA